MEKENDKVYYIYAILDTSKPGEFIYNELRFEYEPFYIGKGTEERFVSTLNDKRVFKASKIKSIRSKGLEPIVIKIFENITNLESITIEIDLIKLIGRRDLGLGPLTNLTDGGDGRLNSQHTEETIKKISESKKGIPGSKHSEETKKYLSDINSGENNPFYGKKHSDEVRKKQSELVIGEKHPFYGKKHSEETRSRIKEIVNRPDIVAKKKESQKVHNEKRKKIIIQYDLNLNELCRFSCAKEVFNTLSIPESTITKYCRGDIKAPYKGLFYFKYLNLDKLTYFIYKIGDTIIIDELEYILLERKQKTFICKDKDEKIYSFKYEEHKHINIKSTK